MEVNRYDTAKIWRLIGQWVESEPSHPTVTPAPMQTEAEERKSASASVEHAKTPAIKRNRAKSRTSPSNAFQHLHLADGHASRQSSPLVTSHVISEADMSFKPTPLSLPPPNLKPVEHKDSNNIDLVGSDTSASSSYTGEMDSEVKATEASSSDEDGTLAGQLTARRFSDGKSFEAQAALAASLPSHLAMRRRPTLSSISQQPSATSSRTVTRSSSSVNTHLPEPSSGMPRSSSKQLGKTLPEAGVLPFGRTSRALSNESSAGASPSTSQWNVKKDPTESSASGDSDDSDIDDDDQDVTAESLRARGVRRFHRQRAKARQSRSKSRRRGMASSDEKPRRTVSGRQSRSVSAVRRNLRSISKIRAEALQHKVERYQDNVKEHLSHKFGEHLHAIMQSLADEASSSVL